MKITLNLYPFLQKQNFKKQCYLKLHSPSIGASHTKNVKLSVYYEMEADI